MNDLAQRECVPCRGGVPPLTRDAIAPLLELLSPSWQLRERKRGDNTVMSLERSYRFENFAGAMRAAVAIGEVAEQQRHHPDLHVAWGALGVEVWTHKIGGLTESDFVFAAKCDAVVAALATPSA